MNEQDKILILDFGGQTTALIGRRIRETGVYTEIIPGDTPLSDKILDGVKGIILSGSPESVYAAGAIPDKRIYNSEIPLLGICYGLQRIMTDLGGKVVPLPKMEYGGVEIFMNLKTIKRLSKFNKAAQRFLSGFTKRKIFELRHFFSEQSKFPAFTAWMSHGDTLSELAPGFIETGTSATGFPALICHEEKPWFGLQFHPEVSHCEFGSSILASFVLDVCGCAQNWTMEKYLEKIPAQLRKQANGKPLLLLISGGVDSTVTAALLLKALPPEQVHLMYIDTGLMRSGETEEVTTILNRFGVKNLHILHCENEFLAALKNHESPEEKRKIIGDLFISIQEREVDRLKLPEDYFLVQGTLYTDLIESGKGIGKKAHLIKSHHNVGSPLVEAKRAAGKIIEPLGELYKDEARALGRLLSLDESLVGRHPFPGPGLAVRILGEVTHEKCAILREADAVFINELKRRRNPVTNKTLYEEIWQAFAVLLPVRSVGIAGDGRKYGWVLTLRAITSADGMTADVYPFNIKDITEISTLITNTVPQIGRVCLDISSKPPATIEWE
ncbi:MAG: glutamine-hydrolyzing GMP synthase [Spirochaetaceae bacterium]|jgi:GMP synthase (glutamine-hydrolysing)|nr:glutamine-hydrolyzing GMP synthase [Spirochaetaceae bacterium]